MAYQQDEMVLVATCQTLLLCHATSNYLSLFNVLQGKNPVHPLEIADKQVPY